ncbi:MAG: alpha/beta fold hydrolase [Opitutae bacterium]|nr:alpha/beta fold hydrolase [Opitutae bacterium]
MNQGFTPDAVAGYASPFHYTDQSPEEAKYILFVHGWNMEKWEKERYAETAYKRLYWQGYKGRFGLFSWPTTNGFGSEMDAILDSANFDRGEFSGWRSATPLRQLMQTLNSAYGGEFYVLSHSMGGIVASEALRLQSDAGGGQIARVYVASQAALSAHTYDGTLSTTTGSTDALQWDYNHSQIPNGAQNYGPHTANIYKNWMAFMLGGSAVSSSSVGTLVNFYNENDWALAAPAWQFNQITKPDFADYPSLLWDYVYEGDPEGAPLSDGFRKYGKYTNPTYLAVLGLGNRTTLADRYEITSFAAESRMKALGATSNISQGISRAVNLQSSGIWPADADNHSAHKWHSAEFRSTIQRQRNYWKTLLSDQAFDLSTKTLP